MSKLGERATCRHCGQEIEWNGEVWWDRGGNRKCVPYESRTLNRIVRPRTKHAPQRARSRHGDSTVYSPERRALARSRRHYSYSLENWNDRLIDRARAALGLRVHGKRYPAHLTGHAMVYYNHQAIPVRLLKSTAPGTYGRAGMKHRIQFECPHCQKWVPAGRYAQHVVVHYPYGGHTRSRVGEARLKWRRSGGGTGWYGYLPGADERGYLLRRGVGGWNVYHLGRQLGVAGTLLRAKRFAGDHAARR